MPICRPSTSRIGVTSAAVPVKKASSAMYTSSRVMRFSTTLMPSSSARVRMVLRVMPFRQEVTSGVYTTPFLTRKMFSPEPSAT